MASPLRLMRLIRGPLLVVCFLMVAGASVAYVNGSNGSTGEGGDDFAQESPTSIPAVEEELIPPHRAQPPLPPPLPPSPPPGEPAPKPAAPASKPKPPAPKPAPAPPASPSGTGVYGNQGAWVDIFDAINPEAAVKEMCRRGVRTLYLQTGRFKQPEDIVDPARISAFIDAAQKCPIATVAWYVPAFGDIDRDIRSSLAAMNYKTARGNSFDGFAPDIETGTYASDRPRFNAGVAEYSRRLREVAGERALGAIVVDAKNNERAPLKWAGFPWPEMARYYNVILPMAYWSVTKGGACAIEYDTADYMRQVASKTEALMGVKKPFHMIGGIGNCMTAGEAAGFVNGSKETGAVGGSLYDFDTVEKNPAREAIWAETARFNN